MGRLNLFVKMSDDELKQLYKAYSDWNNEGCIRDEKFGNIRGQYLEAYPEGGAIVIMERDYLRECAERFAKDTYEL